MISKTSLLLAIPVLAFSSLAGATPAGKQDAAALVRELSAIERVGIDLDSLSLEQALRDSEEAKKVNELRRKMRSAGPEVGSLLVQAALACKREATMELLLDALLEHGPGEVPAPLQQLLLDPKADVVTRRQLPRYVSKIGDASHAPLLEKLAGEADFKLSREAVFALGALPGRAGLPGLYRLMEKGHDVARGAAAETMGEIDELAAVPKLIDRLLDNDPYVRAFAHGALLELTYRYSPNRPRDYQGQHREWADWWAALKDRSREKLLELALADCLAVLGGKDPREALQRALWLSELSFQDPPNEALFSSPLGAVVQGMEAARWREWARHHGKKGRLEWLRLAVDRAIERLQQPDPVMSWPGLSNLTELIDLPAGRPYLFRAVWIREKAETRLELAKIYEDWWKDHRNKFLPYGRKYW